MSSFLLFLSLLAAPEPRIANPGFEEGPTGWTLPPQYTVDTTVARSGKASLRVENTDPKIYRMATQVLDLVPGRAYEFQVWVRTENVQGEENGATVCVEYSGAQYLGGSYPAGPKGTQDWTLVSGFTRVPENATRSSLVLYLRKGMTGRAWFDDVVLKPWYPPVVWSRVTKPRYRGRLAAGAAGELEVLLRLPKELPDDRQPASLKATVRVAQADRLLASREVANLTAEQRLTLPLPALAAGRYEVTTVVTGTPDGRELGRQSWPLTAVDPAAPAPRVYLDEHGRTIVDGQPFFPLGWYDGLPGEPDLQRLADAGFNTIMPYGINQADLSKTQAFLDLAQRLGVKVIYSLKDLYESCTYRPKKLGDWTALEDMVPGLVGRFKSHPAVLAWYLNDELPLTIHDQLSGRYRNVSELDSDHPTWVVVYQVDQLDGYVDTCDVLGTDPYPVPQKPLDTARQWAARTVGAMGGYGSVWQVPQAFDWANYRKTPEEKAKCRPPTLDEVRTMTYAALTEGAQGLIYYSYADVRRDPASLAKRWPEMRQIATEVNALMPFLLSVEPVDVAVQAESASAEAPLSVRFWRRGRELVGVASNGHATSARATWRLPAAPTAWFGAATTLTATGVELAPGTAVACKVALP